MLLEGKPLRGRELERLKAFLWRMDLSYDEGIEYSVCILDENYEIIGTGSVDQNVIKCVAIDPEHQGKGLSGEIMSNLIRYEFEKARTHLFIYTKPKNKAMFADMGFYVIFETEEILFMENRARGFDGFLETLQKETPGEALDTCVTVGAVVANCNPFTLGHRYLLERAMEQCEYLHLFVLSDERSCFSAEERYQMVENGIVGLSRVILHRTQDYMISSATFPTYFFKEELQGRRANCLLDLELFAKRIAPWLHIKKRFVGSEPYCTVTREYNEAMQRLLPVHGIEVTEFARKSKWDEPISASRVRRYIDAGEFAKIRELVPEGTYAYLCQKRGK